MRYSDLTIVSVSLIINLNSTNVDLEWRFIFRLDDRRWQSRDSNLRLSSERRKRENNINNHNNHTLFYQSFSVLQMRSSVELIKHFDIVSNSIFRMIKSLYDVLEIDNHWFVTYHVHHVNKLDMIQSTYDFCLLHTNMKIDTSSILQINLKNDHFHTNHFHTDMKIVDMQIDNTLILINVNFAVAKKRQSLMLKSWLSHEIVSTRIFR
jgi:hypothetical protein